MTGATRLSSRHPQMLYSVPWPGEGFEEMG